MADQPALKRPKLEDDDSHSAHQHHLPVAEDEEAMAEEAVLALVAHRERDVERCKLKLLHYQSLLDTAETQLAEAQSRLARYRDRNTPPAQPVKREPKSPPPPPIQRHPKPSLVIPGPSNRPAPRPEPMPAPLPPERSSKEDNKPKRKIDKEHHNLTPSVNKSSATVLKFQGGTLLSSQH
ncbi:unnamed protein product, partial [Urochloa humidicola]